MTWRWDGKPALLQSRAVDETGFVQPTIAELRARARRQRHLQQQFDPDLAGQAGRERVRCPARLRLAAPLAAALVPAGAPAFARAAASGRHLRLSAARRRRAEIAGWDIDGAAGRRRACRPATASVDQGAEIYADQCAACHGTFGEGEGRYPKLAGGEGTLTGERPEPTVGSYWPFATTLVGLHQPGDAVSGAALAIGRSRSMRITAYVLNLNNIVPNDFVADRNSLAQGEDAEPR